MKKTFNAFLLVIMALFAVNTGFAQDPHFSQFNATPLVLNPANAGVFNGCYRLTGIYRSQWHSILKFESIPMYRTFSGSFDVRLNNGFSKFDAWGIGVAFLSDKAGESEFGTNHGSISFSYIKALNQKGTHYITFGAQGGLTQRSINFQNLKFGNQFDGENYNPNLPHNEVFSDDNFMFFDVSAGILWYYFLNKRTNFNFGFSALHLNRPNQSFYEDPDTRLYMRFNAHGGMQFALGGQVDLVPSFLFMMQGPAVETMLGTYLKFFFEPNQPQGNAFYIGPWYRIVGNESSPLASESLILATRVDYGGFTLGFSYDLNFSDLTRATNGKGGFEVYLTYIIKCSKRGPDVRFCPRF